MPSLGQHATATSAGLPTALQRWAIDVDSGSKIAFVGHFVEVRVASGCVRTPLVRFAVSLAGRNFVISRHNVAVDRKDVVAGQNNFGIGWRDFAVGRNSI